jgi:hypothetical protein
VDVKSRWIWKIGVIATYHKSEARAHSSRPRGFTESLGGFIAPRRSLHCSSCGRVHWGRGKGLKFLRCAEQMFRCALHAYNPAFWQCSHKIKRTFLVGRPINKQPTRLVALEAVASTGWNPDMSINGVDANSGNYTGPQYVASPRRPQCKRESSGALI